MSRKTVLLLAALYFLAALAFSLFHVLTNPFLSDLNAPAAGKAVAGAVLLYAQFPELSTAHRGRAFGARD
jgi:hypothetical protein